MNLRDANLQVNEKNFHTSSFMYFYGHILRIHYDYFFRRVLESVQTQFISGNINGFLVIYRFPYNPQLSPYWICSWTFSWVQFLSNKLELVHFLPCKDYKNVLLFALFFNMYFYKKKLIVLHHGDIIFYSILTSVWWPIAANQNK